VCISVCRKNVCSGHPVNRKDPNIYWMAVRDSALNVGLAYKNKIHIFFFFFTALQTLGLR